MDKEKFIWLLNNSVKITTDEYPDSIFYYMDKNIERKIKLNNVLDNNKIIDNINIDNINIDNINIDNNIDNINILFEQDKKNLWVNYDQIWNKLKSNIEYKVWDLINDMELGDLIDGWLKNDTNWKFYTPFTNSAKK